MHATGLSTGQDGRRRMIKIMGECHGIDQKLNVVFFPVCSMRANPLL